MRVNGFIQSLMYACNTDCRWNKSIQFSVPFLSSFTDVNEGRIDVKSLTFLMSDQMLDWSMHIYAWTYHRFLQQCTVNPAPSNGNINIYQPKSCSYSKPGSWNRWLTCSSSPNLHPPSLTLTTATSSSATTNSSSCFATVKCCPVHWTRLVCEVLTHVCLCTCWFLSLTTYSYMYMHYIGTPLLWTSLGQPKVSWLVRCPHFRGSFVHISLYI